MNTTHPTAPASMATHTPTPFSLPLEVHETREGPSIRDSQGERIAEAYTEQGAQAIVRAVNSHAQLVAALDRASMVAEYANLLSCCKTIKEATDAKLYSKLATALVEFREARAALTAATPSGAQKKPRQTEGDKLQEWIARNPDVNEAI